MKRIFTTILSVTMALVLSVFASGCSGCNGNVYLTFTQDFYGKGEPSVGYKESLSYSVDFDDNYNSSLKKSAEIKDQAVTYDYEGTYASVFEVIGVLSEEIETNIPTEGLRIYHLSTNLTLTSTYKANGKYAEGYIDNGDGTVSYEEYVKSEVFFLDAGHSFSPIFSKTEQKYTLVQYSGSTADITLVQSSYSINYNNHSYKITTVSNGKTSSKTYGYSFRSVVDNNQLLFAIRCMDIKADSNAYLPVVSTSYGTAQSLLFSNKVENTKNVNVNNTTAEIPVKNIKFNVSNQYNTGSPHFLLIQKSSPTDAIPNKALVVEYAAPLVAYGNFINMGALVYTLTTAEIS